MTATAFPTELDARNMMLTAADEAPVQTASHAGHLPLSIAKAVLNDTSRVVQSKRPSDAKSLSPDKHF